MISKSLEKKHKEIIKKEWLSNQNPPSGYKITNVRVVITSSEEFLLGISYNYFIDYDLESEFSIEHKSTMYFIENKTFDKDLRPEYYGTVEGEIYGAKCGDSYV